MIKLLFFALLLTVSRFFLLIRKNDQLVFTPKVIVRQPLTTPMSQPEVDFTTKTLSLENIFSEDHSWTDILSRDKKQVMIATGDVLLARSVNYKTVTSKNFTWPFEKTADVLKSANITLINLETPLINNCPLTTDGMKFCGDIRNIEGLLFAGVDVVNVANNHAGDHGTTGLNTTITSLHNAGLIISGVSGPVYKDVNGSKFAFLGYNDVNFQSGISEANHKKIANEVSLAKANADIVVVQFHWGNEYTSTITANQRMLAQLAIDSGADVIIGNHPHWIQPIEIYKDKLITYAHENFIFDQEWSLKTKQGVVGQYTFYDNTLIDVEFFPVLIEQYGQPRFLTGKEKKAILERMKLESFSIKSTQDEKRQ